MQQDCQKEYIPNYNNLCCLKHLIILNNLSEMRLLDSTFGKFLIKNLNNFDKNNKLILSKEINLENSINFLNILSKYISHYYFLGKNTFSKFLCKIAFKFSENLIFREHPDIIIRISSIKNNIACIYEYEKKYEKSITNLSYCEKYLTNNLEKLIYYSNLIRIISKKHANNQNYFIEIIYNKNSNNFNNENNENNKIIEYIENWKKYINEELDKFNNVKNLNNSINYRSRTNNDRNNNYNYDIKELKIISICIYNYAIFLEKLLKKILDAKEILKKGYEFSICNFGDNHFITIKYQEKLNKISNVLSTKNTFNLEDESELDLMNGNNLDMSETYRENGEFNNKINNILQHLESIGKQFEGKEINQDDKKFILQQTEEIKSILKFNKKKSLQNKNSNKEKLNNNNIIINNRHSNSRNKNNNQEKHFSTDGLNVSTIERQKSNNLLDNESISEEEKILSNVKDKNESNNNLIINNKKDTINLLNDELNNSSSINERPKFIDKFKSHLSKIIPSISLVTVEDKDYKSETFFQKADIKVNSPTINIKLDEANNDDYNCVTYFQTTDTNHIENNVNKNINNNNNNSGSYEQNFIESERKYLSELIKIKRKDFLFFNFFNSIEKINPKKEEFFSLRYINNEDVYIKLLANETIINIELINNKKEKLDNIEFDYNKLSNLLNQINLYIMTKYQFIYEENININDFIKNYLLFYISVRYQENTYKFGISQNPIGIFLKKSINFKVRHVLCVFDIIILEQNKLKIILYSSNDEKKIIFIDAFIDNESFDLIFKRHDIYNIFILSSSDYTSDENIINIGKNIQKTINNFCVDRYNTFDDLCLSKGQVTFKCEISNKCNNLTLFICDFSERLFKVFKINENLNKLDGIIYSSEMKDIFGYEINDLYNRTNKEEKNFLSQFIMNCITVNEIDEKTEKIVIMPFNVTNNFSFINSNKIINYSIYEINKNHFMKLLIYNPLTNQDYYKIFKIVSKKDINKFSFDTYKDKLEEIYLNTLNYMMNENDYFISYIEI